MPTNHDAGFKLYHYPLAAENVLAPDSESCKCGALKSNTIHSVSTEFQKMHQFIPQSPSTSSVLTNEPGISVGSETVADRAREIVLRALTQQNARFALYREQNPTFREADVNFWTGIIVNVLREGDE